MANETKDPNEIGALWTKQTKHGNDYFTGTINGQRVVVFKNQKKRSDKSPDWRVLKSEPQQGTSQQPSTSDPPQANQARQTRSSESNPGEPPAWLTEGDDQW